MARRSRWLVVAAAAAVLAAVAVAVAVVGGGDERPRPRKQALKRPADLARAVTVEGQIAHMRALEEIADDNGGDRGAGRPGERASVAYAARRLRAAGWRVRLQRVRFPYSGTRSRPRLVAAGKEISAAALRFTGSGHVAAESQPVGTGCLAEEYRGFTRGRVAIAHRGDCTLRQIALVSQAAGAAAMVVFDDKQTGPGLPGTLVRPGARIPTLSVARADGRRLVRSRPPLRLRVDARSDTRTTTNVIAELGRSRTIALAGAHIDSVPEGSGTNDNASGVATLLELAEQIGASSTRPRRRLRLAFWGAEELGLHGSRAYVRRLPRGERRRIAAYLNLDMVASANGGRFFYGGRRRAARRAARTVRRFLRSRGTRLARTEAGSNSDHAPFASAGIPVLGLYSGGPEAKERAQRLAWGGKAGRPFDACYHRACDRLSRVDRRTLSELSDGAAVVVYSLAFRRRQRPREDSNLRPSD